MVKDRQHSSLAPRRAGRQTTETMPAARNRDQFPLNAVCSRCHLPSPGYDHSPNGVFSSSPVLGFLVFLQNTMRRGDGRCCGVVAVDEVRNGKRKLIRVHRSSKPVGRGDCRGKRRGGLSHNMAFGAVEQVVTRGVEHRALDLAKLPEPEPTHDFF